MSKITGISGYDDSPAMICNNVPQTQPFYEKDYSHVLIAPWLGQSSESTFLNRLKLLDDPFVPTYRQIKLLYDPDVHYESIVDPNIEHFSTNQYIIKMLILLFAIIIVFVSLKSIE